MRRLSPLLVLFTVLMLAPFALRPAAPVADAAQVPPPPTLSQTVLPAYGEQEAVGASTNNTIPGAETIGTTEPISWMQIITGTIGDTSDLDYYKLTISQPASRIKMTLDGLPADYDLVLGGGSDLSQTTAVTDTFLPGLEDITQVGGTINSIGGTINSIGGTINSIGGTINSIGGTINSIGGTINSIGGTINSISVNRGTTSEAIDTLLWLPGTYYVVVATSKGEHSTTPYQLTVTVTDSGLSAPPATPEVSLNLDPLSLTAPISDITTLYIYNTNRMANIYTLASGDTSLSTIASSLNRLANRTASIMPGAPVEKGVLINLGDLVPVNSTQTISDVYTLWDTNQTNPLYANYVAGLIDNVIEAATSDGVSGPGKTTQDANFYAGSSGRAPIFFPNLRNIVLVGGDAVLPFYRVPDLATVANEADYATYMTALNANGIVSPDSPQGAALRYRMLLTDNPYGAGRPYRFYGFPLYLPHLAVGRIVERPEQVAQYLEFYGGGSPDLVIDVTTGLPQRAFVSGYDFLQDQATKITALLTSTGLASSEINSLNNNTWQRPEVEQAWFNGRLATDFPLPANGYISGTAQLELSSVNAHFDHWQLLPAVGTSGNFTAQRMLDPTYPPRSLLSYFGGTLGYSVGCHSGYNVADEAVPATTTNQALYQADVPQAQNRQGGNWVGNTGYGYGTADGVNYSEHLAVLYTEELARDNVVFDPLNGGLQYIGATIGEALVNAKQRYIRNAASLGAYDYKVINITTLYGLPFLRTKFTTPLPPPDEDPSALPGVSPVEMRAPRLPDSVSGLLTRTITFTIALTDTNFVTVARTGSTVMRLSPSDFKIDDEFIGASFNFTPTDLLRLFDNSQSGTPTLPAFAYDIGGLSHDSVSPARLRVRDVVFLGGSFLTKPNFNPQITQIVTDTTTPIVDTTTEPDFDAGAGLWYPDIFFGFSSVGEDEQQRDQLTSFAAQMKTATDGQTGLLHPYTQMVFQVLYDDPSVQTPEAIALSTDSGEPVIDSVDVQATNITTTALAATSVGSKIIVEATDSEGSSAPLTVSAVYMTNTNTWEQVSFTGGATAGTYNATLPVRPSQAQFVVRVMDSAGNVTYYTGKGEFTTWSELALPLIWR